MEALIELFLLVRECIEALPSFVDVLSDGHFRLMALDGSRPEISLQLKSTAACLPEAYKLSSQRSVSPKALSEEPIASASCMGAWNLPPLMGGVRLTQGPCFRPIENPSYSVASFLDGSGQNLKTVVDATSPWIHKPFTRPGKYIDSI